MNTLAKNIRKYRHKKGLSQEQVAEALGYKSFTTIQKWESGVSEPSISKLHELAELLVVDVNALVDQDEDPYYLNPESARIAQEAFENPELRILFDAARNVEPEDLKYIIDLVKRLEKEENPDPADYPDEVYEDDHNQDPGEY